jgi:ribosomal protein L44E
MPEPETVALDLTCAECGRSPRAGETWRILFADIGEAVTYCPECAEREFGDVLRVTSLGRGPRGGDRIDRPLGAD